AAIGLATAGVIGWSSQAQSLQAVLPQALQVPDVSGWTSVPYRPHVPWVPRATGAERTLIATYQNADDQKVDVFYALYSTQVEGREASGFGEGALVPDSQWRWHSTAAPNASFAPFHTEWLRA